MPQFKSVEDYQKFDHAVKRELRYVRGNDHEDFLRAVLETSRRRRLSLTKDTYQGGVWRAQVGHSLKVVEKGGKVHKVPCPFLKERMKPDPDKVTDGRANPKGIACLYLCTHYETAILEVRPLIGSFVTVANMTINRNLQIVDCTSTDVNMWDRFGVEIMEEIEKAVWSDINDAFSKPAERSDSSLDYISTQILAELFKCNGVDGLGYKSSYGETGLNLALFDIDSADVGECDLYRVDDISLKLSRVRPDPVRLNGRSVQEGQGVRFLSPHHPECW